MALSLRSRRSRFHDDPKYPWTKGDRRPVCARLMPTDVGLPDCSRRRPVFETLAPHKPHPVSALRFVRPGLGWAGSG
jgi:hypothetical protein